MNARPSPFTHYPTPSQWWALSPREKAGWALYGPMPLWPLAILLWRWAFEVWAVNIRQATGGSPR